MTYFTRCLFASAFMLMLAARPIGGYADDGHEALLADLKKQWDTLDGALVDLKGEAIETLRFGKEVRDRQLVYFILAEQSQRIHSTDLETGAEKAHAQSLSEENFFNLRRSNAKEQFKFSKLESLAERHRKADNKYALQTNLISQWVRAPLVVYGRSLPEMVSSDRFVLHGIERVEGTNLVDVNFTYRAEPGKRSFLDARVTLMEDNFWSVKSFHTRTELGTTDGFVEYFPADEQSAVRLPKRVVAREWSAAPIASEWLDNWEVEFKELTKYEPVPRDFMLASFGVEEVDFAEDAIRP